MKRKNILFTAKDNLVSGENFQVLWNEKKQRGETIISRHNDLSKYYSSKYYISHKENKAGLVDNLYFTVQKWIFNYKAKLINRYTNGKKILDYGSGIGNFGRHMANLNYNVSLLEPNNKARFFSKNQGLNTHRNIEELSDGEQFNLISLWHVLEHLSEPENVLLSLHKCLTNQGLIFVAVPNFKSYDACFYRSDWAALDVPRHLWHFTTPGMKSMFNALGFKFKAKHPLWFDAFYISYLSEKHLRSRFPLFKGLVRGFISNINALFSGEYSSLIYVFEKTSNITED